MLHVLFILLKILGIVLLLFLFLIVVVMITPIRYSLEMERREAGSFCGQCKVTWLLSFFYVRVSYIDKVFDYRVRILGWQITGNQAGFIKKKEEKRKKKEARQAKKEAKAKKTEKSELQENPEDLSEEEGRLKATSLSESDDNRIIKEVPGDASGSSSAADASLDAKTREKPEKHRMKKEASDKKDKEKKSKTDSEKMNITDKIRSLRENIEKWRELYDDYHGRELLLLLKDKILRLLGHILPVKLKGRLLFGFDDPSVTGRLTGIAALFYPKYEKNFTLEPDFQEKYFETELFCRGRIRPGYILGVGISILLDKNVRRIIKKMLNH